MYFNVARLLMKSSGYQVLETLDDELKFDWALEKKAEVKGSVVIIRTDSGVWVSGDINVDLYFDCSRCLTCASQLVNFQIEEEYLPYRDINTGRLIIESEEYDGFRIDDDNILDLTEAVRQYSSVSSPVNPLCDVDCKGLCPHCGSNLNKITCRCKINIQDRRWGPLLDLLQ